ncbi:hypothetical protein, partial [Oxalobacter paraformigenes]|uniref:hypothetical protein n=1 Tax=Oxalobacter paraformigenes TaxID=556268 RepID=UPI001C9C4C57
PLPLFLSTYTNALSPYYLGRLYFYSLISNILPSESAWPFSGKAINPAWQMIKTSNAVSARLVPKRCLTTSKMTKTNEKGETVCCIVS